MSRVLIDESSNYYMKKEIVKILRDNRILYLVDFYRSDDTKLSRILKGHLSLKQIYTVKREFAAKIIPDINSGMQLYLREQSELMPLKSGIKGLDLLLRGGFLTRGIYEFYGSAGSGKTILIDTIVINIMAKYDDIEALYLDTKGDFSAMRLYNIMQAKDLPDSVQEKIFQSVRVIKIYEVEELMAAIKRVLDNIETLDNLRILVIDSLPAIFYQFLENYPKMAFHINSMVCFLRDLADKGLLILVTNMLTNHGENVTKGGTSRNKSYQPSFKPALGNYWASVANHRILISRLDFNPVSNAKQEVGELNRQLTLLKSCDLKTGIDINRKVKICHEGVV